MKRGGHDVFFEAIQSHGLTPPANIEPGRFYRFSGIDSNGNTAGWALLFQDGQGGMFGDWASDLRETWQAKRDKVMTEAEQEVFRRQVAEG